MFDRVLCCRQLRYSGMMETIRLVLNYNYNYIYFKRSSSYSLRSNKEQLLSPPNCKTLVTLGDRAFVAAAPKLWNALPKDARNAETVDSFKRLLKSHLFKLAFLLNSIYELGIRHLAFYGTLHMN